MDPQEKRLRDMFVDEYLKDYDSYRACLRVGFQSNFAVEYSKKFLAEPYVQRRLADLQRTPSISPEIQEQQDKALVLSVLRQAAQNGLYATRVAAASKLASIYGMDKLKAESSDSDLIAAFKELATRVPA